MQTASMHAWDCLQVVPTATAGAMSGVEVRDGRTFWNIVELDAAGAVVLRVSADLMGVVATTTSFPVGPCPSVAATPNGFVALFDDAAGAGAIVDVDRRTFASSGASVIRPVVAGAPIVGGHAVTAVGDAYAVDVRGADQIHHVRVFDRMGRAVSPDLSFPAGVFGDDPVPSPPGILLISIGRYSGPWGWVEVTCGVE
jgi:hypothetical protein